MRSRAKPADKAAPISPEALELHRRSVIVDLHADTPTLMRMGYDLFRHHRPMLPWAALGYHVDIPRMRLGGLTGQIFGLVTFPLSRVGLLDSAMTQIELIKEAATRRPDRFRFVTEAHEIEQAKAEGAVASLCGLEGAHALEGELESLTRLADEGLRYVGLAHFTANAAASPAFGLGSSRDGGLQPFGKQLVEKSNELGVLVDLAHVNRAGFLEAVELSTDPVIVSHTGLSAVHDIWRNIDDDQIRAVADTGGCVGIIFSRHFLGGRGLDKLVEHLTHLVNVGGEGCAALGSDFDGFIVPPKGLSDVSALPRLTQALLDASFEERVIQKILGGNVLRVLRSVPPRRHLAYRRDAEAAVCRPAHPLAHRRRSHARSKIEEMGWMAVVNRMPEVSPA
jgi:membrane dipeptidase